jgi:hypothetical protein
LQLDEGAPLEAVERVHDPRTTEVDRPQPCTGQVVILVLRVHRPPVVEGILSVGNDRGDRGAGPLGPPWFVRERLVRFRREQHRASLLPVHTAGHRVRRAEAHFRRYSRIRC